MSRLKDLYNEQIVDAMTKKFGYKNVMEVPKLSKIVINMGVGEAKENAKLLDAAISDMEAITGQKAVTTKAKNSVANFKIREGMPIGCKVTLRGIRNANTAKHDTVDVPASKMKIAIADILVNEGYIAKYELSDEGAFQNMHITLKYGADKNEKIITGLKRISKPGLRIYVGKDELPRVLGGLGIAILSTNQGVITDKEARKLQVGGEVLAFVW